MNHIWIYLFVGVGVFVCVYTLHLIKEGKNARSLLRNEQADMPFQKRMSMRMAKDLALSALTGVVMIALWPMALGMIFMEHLERRKHPAPAALKTLNEGQGFAVRHHHLQQRWRLDEVEQREMVTDPLNAVPELPFGHLHGAWQSFIRGHTSETELWSFSALVDHGWEGLELQSGYVMVRDGVCGPSFLTVRKRLQKDAEIGAG